MTKQTYGNVLAVVLALCLSIWLQRCHLDERQRQLHYLDNVDKIGDYVETHGPSTASKLAFDLSIPEQEVIQIGDDWGKWSPRSASGERRLLSIESTQNARDEMDEEDRAAQEDIDRHGI